MSKTPKEVAEETLNKINKELTETKRKADQKEQEVTEVIDIINKCIEEAYQEVSVKEKPALYRAIALLLHPDKFKRNYLQLFDYLQRLKISEEPFKILSKINAKHLLQDAAKDPQNGFISILAYINDLISPMETALERYYQPVKFLAKTAYWTLYSLIVVAAIVGIIALVASALVVGLATGILNLTLNLVTANQYRKEVNNFLEPNFEEYKKAYLKSVRDNAVQSLKLKNMEAEAEIIQNMSDDVLFEQLINEKLKYYPLGLFMTHEDLREEMTQKCKQEILDSVFIDGFSKLKVIAFSLYKAIMKPLDEFEGNKYAALFIVKPLQALASPFILGAAALVELATYTLIGVALAGVLVSSLTLVAALAVLDTPLYALDLCRYIARKTLECTCTAENKEELNNNAGPNSLLALEWKKESTLSSSESPPVHNGPLFMAPRSETKAPNILDKQENLSYNIGFN